MESRIRIGWQGLFVLQPLLLLPTLRYVSPIGVLTLYPIPHCVPASIGILCLDVSPPIEVLPFDICHVISL